MRLQELMQIRLLIDSSANRILVYPHNSYLFLGIYIGFLTMFPGLPDLYRYTIDIPFWNKFAPHIIKWSSLRQFF